MKELIHPRGYTYRISIGATVFAFIVTNIFNYWRPVMCSDCFWPYGVPFTF